MQSFTLRHTGYWTFHYLLIALYVIVALFPLFWMLKVSITPNDLLYTEGVRLWPSRATIAHYTSVISNTEFPLFFLNSCIVSAATSVCTTFVAAGAGYAFSRFQFRGKVWIVGLMLVTQMFPLVMILSELFRVL
jgi:multiple sugar transport system permease protein